MDGVRLCSLLWSDRILRRSATTGLMVEASRKVHVTIGLLFLPDVGVRYSGEALIELKTASWRTSTANSRSELVMVPSVFVKLTSFWTMSAGHFTLQAKLMPCSFGLIKTPTGALSRGICVPHARRVPVEKIGRVGRVGCHLDTQALPEFYILVEPGGEVGHGVMAAWACVKSACVA